MILELPRRAEHFGAVSFHDVQKVYELDSGMAKFPTLTREAVATILTEDINRINQQMAIVVPVKDERLLLLEGALSGIPHDCTVIIVSNSRRTPADRFAMEKQMIKQFNHFVNDEIILIHQKDRGISEAFASAGSNDILDTDGSVRDGKTEGMYIGILLAKMLNKRYVGFIDADNYIPGAVHEYIEIYAAGFILTQRPYSMVRISWVYKPKVVDQKIFFPKWGRVSEITNKHLNQLIESYTGFGTEIIKTANAGEHAMSMQLADVLTYSAGFSGETFELVNMLEQFGGIKSSPHPEVMSSGVDVYQVETRNPHLHEEKEESHLAEMLSHSLGALHNSEICPQTVRDQIAQSIPVNGIRLMNKIKPPCDMDFNRFSDELKSKSESLTFFK